MSVLETSIQQILQAQSHSDGQIRTLPRIPAIQTAYDQVRTILGEAKFISALDPHEGDFWVSKARESFYAQTMITEFTGNDIKNISRCLWHGETPLASDGHFLGAFLNVCDQKLRKSLCHVLIWAYLHHYDENRAGIALLGTWLANTVTRWDWPWADRQRNFKLFNGRDGAFLIRTSVQQSPQAVVNVLAHCGLKGHLASTGMGAVAFAGMIADYQNFAGTSDNQRTLSYLNRLIEWACLDRNSYSYQKLRTAFIEATLLPWENRTPSADIRAKTQSFLVDNFKDPRLGGLGWANVSESSQRVIRRWLIERSLEQFLDVVDRLAVDNQWKYRRAFWMAYYKRNAISDAWVGFATSGATESRQIARRNNDNSWLSFATLTGSGDPRHAILILKIGDLTIADFSHNGKWRIWGSANRLAPKPYDAKYDRNQIINAAANAEGVHSNSDRGTWQKAVAEEIANRTGIRLSIRDYMP